MSTKEYYDRIHIFCISLVSQIISCLLKKSPDKINVLINTKISRRSLRVCINDIWSIYHEGTDKRIQDELNNIKNFQILNHMSCIIRLILSTCSNMVEYLEEFAKTHKTEIKPEQINQKFIINILKYASDQVTDEILKQNLCNKCSTNCKIIEYNPTEKFLSPAIKLKS